METTAAAPVKASGLSTVVNTIAAPSEAFESLRVAPTWGWALLIAVVLMVIGTYLQGPATRHAGVAQMQQTMATSTFFANMSAEAKARAIAQAGRPNVWGYLFVPIILLIAAFVNAVILLIGNALGRGQADFKRLFAGSVNIAVPTIGIGSIVLGLIVMLRGPESFNSTLDVLRAMPSLAWLTPHSTGPAAAFAAAISIFSVWGFFLNAAMLRVTAKTSAGVAYAFAGVVLLVTAAFPAAGVAVARSFGMM